MGWEVAIVGDVEAAAGWRSRRVDSERQRPAAKTFRESAELPAAAALEVVRALHAEGAFRVVERGGSLEIRGLVPHEVFAERARQIVGLVAALAGDDGDADVLLVGVGALLGYRIAISGGDARVTKLRAAEAAVLESDPRVRQAIELSGEKVGAVAGRVEPPVAAAAPPPAAPPEGDPASMLAELSADPIASLREGPEPHFAELATRAAPLRRLVRGLAAARYEPAHAALVAIWREHPWPSLRADVERAGLDAGVQDIVRGVAARLEDEARRVDADGARSMTAVDATFRLDPKNAVDRLAPYFRRAEQGDPLGVAVTQSVLGLLAFAGERGLAFAEQAARSRGWLEADARWRDIALDTLRERSDSAVHSAIAILTLTRDPRGPLAVVDALAREAIDVAAAKSALAGVRDPSLEPRLREEARRRKGRKAEAKALDELASRVGRLS